MFDLKSLKVVACDVFSFTAKLVFICVLFSVIMFVLSLYVPGDALMQGVPLQDALRGIIFSCALLWLVSAICNLPNDYFGEMIDSNMGAVNALGVIIFVAGAKFMTASLVVYLLLP